MTRKLMIAAWSGPLPEWSNQWLEHVNPLQQFGWDFRLLLCEDTIGVNAGRPAFNQLVFDTLGIRGQVQPGTRKVCDYRPAFGVLFADMLKGYDFWGHVDLDCVYGRLDRFLPDCYLDTLDIFGNDPGAICGPFSLYRNIPRVNNLFFHNPAWRTVFKSTEYCAFDEQGFSETVFQSQPAGIRWKSAFWQSHDKQPWHLPTPRVHLEPDGTLIDGGMTVTYDPPPVGAIKPTETMMFHFNRKDVPKRWPIT